MLSPASKANVEAVIKQINDAKIISSTSQQRLVELVSLIDQTGYINYAKAYALLFPKSMIDAKEKAKADKAFSKFRRTIQTITEEHEMPLVIRVDDNKTSENNQRHLWFECEDNIRQRVEVYNKSHTDNLPGHLKDQTLSIDTSVFRYLLIYAEAEKKSTESLHKQLRTQLKIHGIAWKALDYHAVPIGQHIEQTRQRYYREAQFLVLLLSPTLIEQLMEDVLFKQSTLPKIPLAFKQVAKQQLKSIGLNEYCFFTDVEDKPWASRQRHKQEEWIALAYQQMLGIIQPVADQHRQKYLTLQLEKGCPSFEQSSQKEYVYQQFAEKEKQAIPYLLDWLVDPQGEVFCAIFGELGMGKTTLCQRLTQTLLNDRKQQTDLPFPVYFDLRTVNNWAWDNNGVPTLDQMIKLALDNTYNLAVDEAEITVNDIKHLAQKQGALIIFDGLDEVMNRLTPDQSNQFIRQLWNILPPTVYKQTGEVATHGRLIMTCRSHYFQTLKDQLNTLTGEQRERIKLSDYNWVTLLPLNKAQVENYYRQVFSDHPAQAERMIRMLDEIHNLRELSSRPYNMKLIQDQVDTLESLQRQDKKVTVADLYEGMVGQWLHRDKPKHRLSLEHKLIMMESLALLLWKGQKRQIYYADLEDWLTDQLLANKRWQLSYQSYLNQEQGLAILQQDLRNASFLVRHDDDSFRFAHTSIMEFFLARALYRSLLDKHFEAWAISLPSAETLDFLAQLIAREQTDCCLKNMAILRQQYQPLASEVLLHYALRAYQKGYPGAVFSQFDLSGAALKNLHMKALPDKPLNWVQANFAQADLRNAQFTGINFSESHFTESQLDRCLFDSCCLDKVKAPSASMIGTIFHHCTAEQADFTNTHYYRTQWLPTHSRLATDQPACHALQQQIYPQVLTSECIQADKSFSKISFKGHESDVTAVAYAPDGQRFATASEDKTVKVWEANTGECLQTLTGHNGYVTAVAYAPDGQRFVTTSKDNTVKLWDANTGECQQTFIGHEDYVTAVAYAPDGQRLATASRDGTVKVWEANTGECQQTLIGHDSPVTAVAYAPDGQRLVSASRDGTVKLWDASTRECLQTLTGHKNSVTAVAYAPNGQSLATASWDKTVKLWDANTGECQQTLIGHYSPVTAVAYAPDGQCFATASSDKTVKVWEASTGECQQTLIGHAAAVTAVAYAPDEQCLATASWDNTVKLWDASTGECLQTLTWHKNSVTAVVYAPDGQSLATASWDKTVKLWDASTGECQQTLAGHDSTVTALAYAPDGQRLVSASRDGTVKLWDANTGECQQALTGHDSPVTAVAFATDGQHLATASWDKTVKVWDANTGECQQALTEHDSDVTAVAYAPDGQHLATASDDDTVKLWDTNTGECQQTLTGHNGFVAAVAYAPDGQHLATASKDNTVKLWDASTGECLQTLTGHKNSVTAVAYAPDEQSLATASWDNTIKLWDANTGECQQTLTGHEWYVTALAYAPDGQSIISASLDGSCIRWKRNFFATSSNKKARFEAQLKMEHLPEGNWVTWTNPNQPAIPFAEQHWQYYSKDAWRWLGWNAPSPDGKSMTRYPMEYFVEE